MAGSNLFPAVENESGTGPGAPTADEAFAAGASILIEN
jgi:hypothetical protein